jgi:hypothetical protein
MCFFAQAHFYPTKGHTSKFQHAGQKSWGIFEQK